MEKQISFRKERERKRQYIMSAAKMLYALEYKGRYCVDCNFDSFTAPYFIDFHHENSAEKEYEVKNKIARGDFSRFQSELDKCVLLCAQCHRKRHSREDLRIEYQKDILAKLEVLKEKNGTCNKKYKLSEKETNAISSMALSGSSTREISDQLNLPFEVVRNKLKALKIKTRKVRSIFDEHIMLELYRAGYSLRAIGRAVGVGYATIKRRLQLSGHL